MNTNVGNTDRAIRIFIGLMIIGIGIYVQSWWGIIGIIPLFTAFIRWCPAYSIFGISSCGTSSCGCSTEKQAHNK